MWKDHFENLLVIPPKVTHEPIICKQLDIKLGPFTQEELDSTSIQSTERNGSSNNDSLQKHKSESTFTGWRHRILRHCSRSSTRGHASPIPLYHLSRLHAQNIN